MLFDIQQIADAIRSRRATRIALFEDGSAELIEDSRAYTKLIRENPNKWNKPHVTIKTTGIDGAIYK